MSANIRQASARSERRIPTAEPRAPEEEIAGQRSIIFDGRGVFAKHAAAQGARVETREDQKTALSL